MAISTIITIKMDEGKENVSSRIDVSNQEFKVGHIIRTLNDYIAHLEKLSNDTIKTETKGANLQRPYMYRHDRMKTLTIKELKN